MLHWQSASRLLIVMLALAIPWPAVAQTDAADGDDVLGAGVDAEETAAPKHKRRNPSDWTDWRNYQASIAGGFGVTFDQADSHYTGVLRWRPGGAVPECVFPGDTNPETCVEVDGNYGGFFSGGAFNLAGRVNLPEFDVPSKPQMFVNASWAPQRQGWKRLANQGFPSELWINSTDFLGGVGQEKYMQIEQSINPRSVLFVGVGTSFLLPIEEYPVRLNATVNYYRSVADVGTRYDFTTSPQSSNPKGDPDQFVSQRLLTHGIAPGIGLDAEIGENNWFALGFYTDFFIGFPLSDTALTETLYNGIIPPNPGEEEKVDFYFDRGINYSIFIGLRLSLARD